MSRIVFYRDERLPFFEIKYCATKEFSYKKHAHEEYSLAMVEKGSSSFWCQGRNLAVPPGSVVFIPSEVLHSCNPDPEQDWKYTMAFIAPQWLQSSLDLAGGGRALPGPLQEPHVVWEKQLMEIRELMDCLAGNTSPLEKESRMIYTLAKLLKSPELGKTGSNGEAYENKRLQAVKDYLDENYAENVTLDGLSQLSGISKYYLIRSFKEKYHIPPHTYQIILRINYAKRELKRHRQISEVAQDAGFYDQSHFIKQFKYFVGTTPEVYQKSISPG